MNSFDSEVLWPAVAIIASALLLILITVFRLNYAAKAVPNKLEPEPLSKVDIEQVGPVGITTPPTVRYVAAKADQSSLKKVASNGKLSVVMDLHSSPRLKRSTSRKDIVVMEEVKPLERSHSKSRIIQSLDNLNSS